MSSCPITYHHKKKTRRGGQHPILPTTQNEQPPELPEEVLLELFRWLPWRYLLRARAVCRAWRRVALDPSLWSRLKVSTRLFEAGGAAAKRTALRVAPCARAFYFCTEDAASSDLLSHTSCALTKLKVGFGSPGRDTSGTLAALRRAEGALQRQADLGRLQKLVLFRVPRERTVAVIEAALAVTRLTDLTVNLRWPREAPASPIPAPRNSRLRCHSLKNLGYFSPTDDPMLDFLLSGHADTLESVASDYDVSSRMVELLSNCSKLRKLSSNFVFPEVTGFSVGVLPSLTDLTLTLWEPAGPLIPFFRAATQLTRVSFPSAGSEDVGGVDHSVMELLLALGSSRRSSLMELSIGRIKEQEALLELPAVLSGFTRLHTLCLYDMPPEGILDCITPLASPCLRLLRFPAFFDSKSMCRTKCCFPVLFDVVLRNRGLHVMGLLIPEHAQCDDVTACDCCRRNAHPHAISPDADHCSLYGHIESEECGLEAHQRNPKKCPTEPMYMCKCENQWICVASPQM